VVKPLNKKAQTPEDAIFAAIIIVLLGIGGLTAVYTYDAFYDQVVNMSVFNNTPAQTAFAAGQTVNDSWDWLILVVLVGFAIGVLIIGYFLDASSIFMPIFIILMIVGIIVAGIMQYTWEKFSDIAMFSTIKTANFPITDHIISNLAVYFTIIAVLAMTATFAKTRGEGDRG